VFSSIKLVIKAEQDLPGTGGGRGRGKRSEAEERKDPNNICTCE
jgi:hypothetical protein